VTNTMLPTSIKEPICFKCKHLIYWPFCFAFPFGIPEQIRIAAIDHTTSIDGDKGIVFTPIDAQGETREETH
jgi:hypothetical protein